MNNIKPIRTRVNAAVVAMILSQFVHAGAFSLYTEGSPAAIGNFAAGIAAEAADPSTGWYNPAGLMLLKGQQALLGGVGVFPASELSGVSTYSSTILAAGGLVSRSIEPFSGLSGSESAGVPSFHYALPFDKVAFGLSIVSPFGLSTNYPTNSAVRYSATRSQLETINVSPEIAWLLNDNISFGSGLDLQYARVKFNRVIGSPAALIAATLPPTLLDSQTLNSGDSFAVGFHAGVLLMFNDRHTRLGVNYQSQMNHEFKGRSQLVGPLADPTFNLLDDESVANPNATFTSNNLFSNNIPLPQIITISGYQDLNAKWALLGSVVYSGWSSFNSITLNNVAVGLPNPAEEGFFVQTTLNSVAPENYRNTWRFAVGANYHMNDRFMIRFGGGYDQTPTVLSDRDVRLPDVDRWALAIGAHYQWRPNLGFDIGYSYLFADEDAVVNNTAIISALSNFNVNARGRTYAQLLGVQVVWKFDQEKAVMK